MKRVRPITIALIYLTAATAGVSVHAETLYVSDELTVPLRSGPSGGHRILHAGLPSGTVLEVQGVDEEAGFTHIKTLRGLEGWVRSQYLVSEPIAKVRLMAAQRALEKARRDLQAEQTKVGELSQRNREQGNANTSSQQRIDALEAELAELKRISASAIDAHATNQKLQEANARLEDELDDLAESHARMEDNVQNEMLMIGGVLLFIGLLAGVVIKARPQRSAWS